jgi:hypothetical protein
MVRNGSSGGGGKEKEKNNGRRNRSGVGNKVRSCKEEVAVVVEVVMVRVSGDVVLCCVVDLHARPPVLGLCRRKGSAVCTV